MARPRLIIVCGIPSSGKSTFALHAADRWGAIGFASETFADALGAAARTASGDLSKEAIVHAYSAMAAAVADALSRRGLVIAVGSFRSEEQRGRFRDIATSAGASVITLRILCPIETAAQRVCSRLASGERGAHRGCHAPDRRRAKSSKPDRCDFNQRVVCRALPSTGRRLAPSP